MRSYAVRFAFGVATSVVAGLVGLVHGPVSGGVFLAFPAILCATLTLLQNEKGTVAAVADARGALVGALGLMAFAGTVLALLGRVPTLAALAAALGAWVVSSLALYSLGVLLAGLLHQERYPPEVPVSLARPLLDQLRRRAATLVVVDAGAGGALGALLSEAPQADGTVLGAVVSPDVQRACCLLGVDPGADAVAVDTAARLAEAARRRWTAAVGLALVGAAGPDNTAVSETFHVAVAHEGTPRTVTFVADRGGQGNWGHAVQVALRVACETLAEQPAGEPAPAAVAV